MISFTAKAYTRKQRLICLITYMEKKQCRETLLPFLSACRHSKLSSQFQFQAWLLHCTGEAKELTPYISDEFLSQLCML